MRRLIIRRTAGLVLVAGVVAALVWAGGFTVPGLVAPEHGEAQASGGSDHHALPRVELTRVEVGEIATYIEATANLVAEHTVAVVAETNGRVVRVGADQGDPIRRGAFLVAIDGSDARRQRKMAEIRLSAAETKARRTTLLADKKLVSAEEREIAASDRELAKQELADARALASRTKIHAPRTGKLTQRTVEVGQYIRVGDPLFELTDFSTLVADIHVPERDAMLIEPGRAVEIVLQAKPDVSFAGTVRRIASVVDTASGTVEIRIEVTDAPEDIRSGTFVTVRMIRQRHDAAHLLPRDAVVIGPRGAHVFVVKDETARIRQVELGDTQKGLVHIVDGVEPGESVVLAGQGALEDGQRVELASERGVG